MPHVIYVAIGFPPAAKSSAYRLKATANLLCEHGCDVTVVTISRDSWKREYGLDPTLSDDVDDRVQIVELPLSRVDIDPDIRTYRWLRARYPKRWLAYRRHYEQISFPEPVFGPWRRALEQTVVAIHDRQPADLVLVSTVPYTCLAAAWKLWRSRGIPYAVDFRDAWSLDVIDGAEAFPTISRRGRWEKKLVDQALRVWCVNEPIRDHYAWRYRQAAGRLRVVPNGSDLVPITDIRRPDPAAGLTFGYLGTANFPVPYLKAVLEGWRLARTRDSLLARSRLVFRGHFGLQAANVADGRRGQLAKYRPHDVIFDGSVARVDVAQTYASWDALLFLIIGGKYATSGKVYEYIATGLPIMSAHQADHGASAVLDGYPLWIPPPTEMVAEQLAESFRATVRTVLSATEQQRRAALAFGARYERRAQMAEAIQDLVESLRQTARPGRAGATSKLKTSVAS
jgi:glycosyltransferase involved in cell wall biosynthesis